MAQDRGQGLYRRAALRGVDRARGDEHPGEYWAYQLAKFESQLSPTARWPGLAVDQSLPADDPIRAGQTLYIAQCLPCHKLNGGGASDVGPDLNPADERHRIHDG